MVQGIESFGFQEIHEQNFGFGVLRILGLDRNHGRKNSEWMGCIVIIMSFQMLSLELGINAWCESMVLP